MVTLLEAVDQAKIDLLKIPGIVGVSHRDNKVILYVETEADKAKVPATFLGFNTEVKVVGEVKLL